MKVQDIPEKIRQVLGDTYIFHAEKTNNNKISVETEHDENYIMIREIRVFDENGNERHMEKHYKLIARLGKNWYELYGDTVEALLQKLVKIL